MPPLMFAVESAVSRALPLSAQRLINCFVEKADGNEKSPIPLFGAPGMDVFCTCGSGPIRGLWQMAGTAYAVSGTSLYSFTSGGSVTELGSGITGSSPVCLSDNGTQLCIVNGSAGWIYTSNGGLVQITSDAFYPANTVNFFDGYFVFDRAGTNEYFLSALYDGTTYNGLDFASAAAKPDTILACPQNLQLLFLMCGQHIELWYDAGAYPFPFQRYAGGVVNYGVMASGTVIEQDGALFFLGTDKVFYRLQANQPIRISTHAIEHAIAQDTNLSEAWCMTYTLEGHKFVVLMLPQSLQTFVFDISTGKWHERQSWDSNNNSLGRWRANAILDECYQSTFIGDSVDGTICKVDWNTYTERGNTIQMLAHSAPLHHDRMRIFVSLLELDILAGVGNTATPNPTIGLRLSRDGGQTWLTPTPQATVLMGASGQTLTRQRYTRLGSGYQYVFELTCTAAVQRVIMATKCDYEVGV